MKEEIYNIYNIVSFSLINNTNKLNHLNNLNPEYKYFVSTNKSKKHFDIIVERDSKTHTINLAKGKISWAIQMEDYKKSNCLKVYSNNLGIRKLFSFTVLKNLYVRSVLMDKLLDVNAALVHSAAFSVGGRTVILAGRPGVFKTSILMDAIRNFQASFIGEENCLIHNGKVYPFPLNIDSISYKIDNYKDENPSGKIQKLQLGFYLIKNSFTKNDYTLDVPDPLKIDAIYYLSKGEQFKIEEVTFENILPSLIENEVLELSIPPTHTLSGIKYNYFKEIMMGIDSDYISTFKSDLGRIFSENLINSRCFRVTSPEFYDMSITDGIIKTLK